MGRVLMVTAIIGEHKSLWQLYIIFHLFIFSNRIFSGNLIPRVSLLPYPSDPLGEPVVKTRDVLSHCNGFAAISFSVQRENSRWVRLLVYSKVFLARKRWEFSWLVSMPREKRRFFTSWSLVKSLQQSQQLVCGSWGRHVVLSRVFYSLHYIS